MAGGVGVFRGSEAVRAGRVSPYQLRSRFRAVYPDIYLPEFTGPTLRIRSEAAWLWSGQRGTIAGLAAAALLGADWVDDDEPVELIWRNTQPPEGVVTRNDRLDAEEVTRVAGLSPASGWGHSPAKRGPHPLAGEYPQVTTPARTAFDLGRRLPRRDAVARLDALTRARPFSAEDVLLLAKRHAGARGLRQLRALLPLVDGGAASPKESWLRLLLIDAGLPAPTTQIPVRQGGSLVRWLDMGWEHYKVAAEYDGDQHRTDRRQYAKDVRALEKLQRMGWIVVRVIAEDRPDDIISRVRDALTRRGYRDT